MENFFKRFVLPSMLVSVLMLIIGVVIFIYPETTLEFIAKIIGAAVIGLGIVGIIQYVNHRGEDSFKLNIFYTTAVVILGIIMMCSYKFVSSIIPIVLGAWIIIDSLIKIRICVGMKGSGMRTWVYPFVMGFLTLIIGIVLVFNPFASAVAIMKIGAILLIIYSIIDIIQNIMIIKYTD